MKIPSWLTSPPVPSKPVFAYGFLVVLVLLLVWNIQVWWSAPTPFPYDRYGNLVVALMLLFNHLAFYFRWSPGVTFVLRVLALGWSVLGLFYVLYGSRMLYFVK